MNNSWISAKNLNVGDKLATSDGKTARITKITWHDENVDVFNLEAGVFHNFVLGDGLIVHNSGKLTPLLESSSGVSPYNFEYMMAEGRTAAELKTVQDIVGYAYGKRYYASLEKALAENPGSVTLQQLIDSGKIPSSDVALKLYFDKYTASEISNPNLGGS